jgi:hypothetical protein
MVVRGELEDLWRGPARCADLAGHPCRVRDVLLEEAGETEVGDLGQAVVREQHLVRVRARVRVRVRVRPWCVSSTWLGLGPGLGLGLGLGRGA